MKRIYMMGILLLAAIFLYPPHSVSAATTLTSGKWATGEITEATAKQTYQFKLTKPSKVTVEVKSYMNELEAFVYNSKETNMVKPMHFFGADPTNPITQKETVYLQAGTYTIHTNRVAFSGQTGKYQVRATWKTNGSNEIEPNDEPKQAQQIKVNKTKIKGQLGLDDLADYYTVEVDRAGKLSVQTKSYIPFLQVELYNLAQVQMVKVNDFHQATDTKPITRTGSIYVEKGTYLVKVSNVGILNSMGLYELQTKFVGAKNNEKEPNDRPEKAQTLKPNREPITGLISFGDRVDYYKLNVPKTAEVKVQLKSHMKWLEVSIYNQSFKKIDTYNYFIGANDNTFASKTLKNKLKTGVYYIGVKELGYFGTYQINASIPTIVPKAPTVKAVKKGATRITGTTYKKSDVVVKIGKKQYKGKSNTKGTFSIKVPKQKAKTNIYVAVTTDNGTSSYKKVQVK